MEKQKCQNCGAEMEAIQRVPEKILIRWCMGCGCLAIDPASDALAAWCHGMPALANQEHPIGKKVYYLDRSADHLFICPAIIVGRSQLSNNDLITCKDGTHVAELQDLARASVGSSYTIVYRRKRLGPNGSLAVPDRYTLCEAVDISPFKLFNTKDALMGANDADVDRDAYLVVPED